MIFINLTNDIMTRFAPNAGIIKILNFDQSQFSIYSLVYSEIIFHNIFSLKFSTVSANQMSKVINVVAIHLKDNLTQKGYVTWVNDILDTQYKKIDEFSTGAAYCQLLEKLFPNCIDLRRVSSVNSWPAKLSNADSMKNFKILQSAFAELKVQVRLLGGPCMDDMTCIDITKITKCSTANYENYKFLEWFKKFYDENAKTTIEESMSRVKSNSTLSLNSVQCKAPKMRRSRSSMDFSKPKELCEPKVRKGKKPINKQTNENETSQTTFEATKCGREPFYSRPENPTRKGKETEKCFEDFEKDKIDDKQNIRIVDKSTEKVMTCEVREKLSHLDEPEINEKPIIQEINTAVNSQQVEPVKIVPTHQHEEKEKIGSKLINHLNTFESTLKAEPENDIKDVPADFMEDDTSSTIDQQGYTKEILDREIEKARCQVEILKIKKDMKLAKQAAGNAKQALNNAKLKLQEKESAFEFARQMYNNSMFECSRKVKKVEASRKVIDELNQAEQDEGWLDKIFGNAKLKEKKHQAETAKVNATTEYYSEIKRKKELKESLIEKERQKAAGVLHVKEAKRKADTLRKELGTLEYLEQKFTKSLEALRTE